MKVFLTGATGYIGTVIAEKLHATGHSVLGLARTEHAAETLKQQGIEPFLGSLHYPQQLTQAAHQTDGVIHTAFVHDFKNWDKSISLDRQVVKSLVGALADSDKPFVVTSDTGVLGDTGVEIADETYPIAQDSLLACRATVEQVMWQAAQHQVRSIVLRLPIYVYGREGGAPFAAMQMQAACEMRVAQYIDMGSYQLSAAHVDDLAELYVLALEKAPAGSLFHAATESGITAQQLAAAIAEVTDSEMESISFEEAVFNWGEAIAAFLSINNQSSAQRAMQQLGWQPNPARSLLQDIQFGTYRALQFAPDAATRLHMLRILCDRTLPFAFPKSAMTQSTQAIR
ncbi:MAG: NAD-dependent epimerase/dehydratase family protein [Leptolyngbya sp. SIO1E4]|nr:NAD-dependent epimerase/dehydratase family protein [Leptolyngbya sp. SIO1E4]